MIAAVRVSLQAFVIDRIEGIEAVAAGGKVTAIFIRHNSNSKSII